MSVWRLSSVGIAIAVVQQHGYEPDDFPPHLGVVFRGLVFRWEVYKSSNHSMATRRVCFPQRYLRFGRVCLYKNEFIHTVIKTFWSKNSTESVTARNLAMCGLSRNSVSGAAPSGEVLQSAEMNSGTPIKFKVQRHLREKFEDF